MCGTGGMSFAGSGKQNPYMPGATAPQMPQWGGFGHGQMPQHGFPGVAQFQQLQRLQQPPLAMAAGGRVITTRDGRKRKVSANSIDLTPEECALCKQLGISEHEFARHKMRMLQMRGGHV